MDGGYTVICIDTGRHCDALYYGKCVHNVKLIKDDGSWMDIGPKSRDEILSLHRMYGLKVPDGHFTSTL